VSTVTRSVRLTIPALALVLTWGSTALLAQKPAAAPRTVVLTASDQMKYDVVSIPATHGETLRIRLKAVGTMPKLAMSHNVVLLKAGTNAQAFADKAINARATAFVPPELKGQVIASTSLIADGEETEVTFTVPAAGRYEYLCTFPGHFAVGMKGVLVVK
jgi:azurin